MSAAEDATISLLDDAPASGYRRLTGAIRICATILATVLAALALYWTQFPIGTTIYRGAFLALVLALAFLLYPMAKGARRDHVSPLDVLLILLSVAALVYLATQVEVYKTRALRPTEVEIALGLALMVAIVEATRRATGLALPLVTLTFLAYALLGPYMPEPFDHRGYSLARIVGQNYLTLEGIFSVPLDVAATFIILFTIFGAVLQASGAGPFYIRWAFALFGRKPSVSAPARASVAAGFLLGTVSGSGVATTVALSSLAWPMLKRAGFPPAVAGGLFAASGIGALLSPPTLGAAAFIIAEHLGVPYFDILAMATIPTFLYYLSCWLMVEADARRLRTAPLAPEDISLRTLTIREGYHFLPLIAIALLLAIGLSTFMAVFWSIVLSFLTSLLRPETRMASTPALIAGGTAAILAALVFRVPQAVLIGLAAAALTDGALWLRARLLRRDADGKLLRLFNTLHDGGRDVVGIAATCACAGIIVSVITLTGLGLQISGLIVDLGQGSLFLTVALAAIAMWILGTAVPVTASYIIGAVMLVPALTEMGVAAPAAHMFLFYYAVLGDVSPPTALAPFAAAAITRAHPFTTMAQAWKYSLPAFLVPFAFCVSPEGTRLLMFGTWPEILLSTLVLSIAITALAGAIGGYMRAPLHIAERIALGLAGLMLIFGAGWWDIAAAALIGTALSAHFIRTRRIVVDV